MPSSLDPRPTPRRVSAHRLHTLVAIVILIVGRRLHGRLYNYYQPLMGGFRFVLLQVCSAFDRR